MRIVLITLICLGLAVPASAGLYKWKDENGKIHFTDDPSRIPLDQRNKKDMKKLRSSKGGKNQLPTAPPPASRPAVAKQEGPSSKGSGIDQNRLNEMKRLIQKKNYNH